MNRTAVFLPGGHLNDFLNVLPGENCFVTCETATGCDYFMFNPTGKKPYFGGIRPTRSLKSFVFPSRETVALYWCDGVSSNGYKLISVVGARNCDLISLKYLDAVFMGGICVDPFYKQRREALFIVSVDCVPPQEKCFCTSIGNTPYVEYGSDLNLTPIESGYLVHAYSERSLDVLHTKRDMFQTVSSEQEMEAGRLRESMESFLARSQCVLPNVDSIVADHLCSERTSDWEIFAGDCVECGACTAICPTCHCYFLIDGFIRSDTGNPENIFQKTRVWDSCLFSEYARMAGLDSRFTSRPHLRNRLVNRVLHKWAYSREQLGMTGCVGCGRCDEACFGGLEMKAMLQVIGESRGSGL